MYIGRLGDGSLPEDGIYVLLKEVVDNSIDEFRMNQGKRIEVDIDEHLRVSVRDYGRGIPQGKLVEAVSMLNTGGKYDSKAFKKSVGLNGVGIKAVNALSLNFEVKSYRDGKVRALTFERGELKTDVAEDTTDENGTYIYFEPDAKLFKNYSFHDDIIETMLRNYTYLNTGLAIMYNGRRILSRNGLKDLLNDTMTTDGLYPIVHLKGEDIEIAFTHTGQYGEEYHSFVNGQHTTQGGTHQSAFKEHLAKTIKEFFNKNFEYTDIRNGLVGAIAINVEEPMFESQTKIKLGSQTMSPDGVTVNKYVGDFIKTEVDNFLHRNADVAEVMLQKIQSSEKERKAMAGVTKLARERAKKANLHNRKLRDCRIHFSDVKDDRKEESAIFITEGDSASGSITKSRDVNTQAVFSLAMLVVQSLTNSFGTTIIAVSTVVMRVDGFAMMPNFTFGTATTTFTGQNIGAGRLDRVEKGTKDGLKLGLSVSVVLVALILFFGRYLMEMFTSTPDVIDTGMHMMRILSIGYIAMAVTQILSGVMRGAGDTMTPMWISLITTIVIRVPIAYGLAALMHSADALFISLLISWVMGAVLTSIAFRMGRWKKKSIINDDVPESADVQV